MSPISEDVVHYRIPDSPLTLCGENVWTDDVSVTERAGSASCGTCRLAADETVTVPETAYEPAEALTAPSAPQVFEVPQPPPGVTRVTDNDGHEWVLMRNGGVWLNTHGVSDPHDWPMLLVQRGPLTDATPGRPSVAPQPVVLRLPEVPKGVAALVGGISAARYVPVEHAGVVAWEHTKGSKLPLGNVLDSEGGSVTVEFAPPREPRTWGQITPVVDLPVVVDVRRPDGTVESWRRVDENEDRYGRPGEYVRTLNILRELGDVTEVLS